MHPEIIVCDLAGGKLYGKFEKMLDLQKLSQAFRIWDWCRWDSTVVTKDSSTSGVKEAGKF